MSDRDVTVAPDDYTAKLMAEVVRLQDENDRLLHQGARLFDKTLDLADENHKLQEQLAEWKRVAESKQDIIDHMRDANAENAKLRELVSAMAYCMQYGRECDGCRLNGADGTITAPVGCDGLLDRMRELGIEVDA